jgi:hypothetical protein
LKTNVKIVKIAKIVQITQTPIFITNFPIVISNPLTAQREIKENKPNIQITKYKELKYKQHPNQRITDPHQPLPRQKITALDCGNQQQVQPSPAFPRMGAAPPLQGNYLQENHLLSAYEPLPDGSSPAAPAKTQQKELEGGMAPQFSQNLRSTDGCHYVVCLSGESLL